MAEIYDGYTTKITVPQLGEEGDPISRMFIGSRASRWRMAAFGTLEVGSVSAIPDRKLRRLTQAALIGLHVFAASKNLAYYYDPYRNNVYPRSDSLRLRPHGGSRH